MAVLSTEAVPTSDRFAYWREVITQQFVHLRPERVGEGPFYGEIRGHKIGGMFVSEVSAAGQRVFRARAEIARSPVPIYFVNVQTAGTGSFRQGKDEVAVSRGDIFVIDPLREFELGVEQPLRQLSVKLPREWMDARMARPDLLAGAVVRRDHPLGRIVASYLVNGFESAEQLTAASAAMVAQHSVELLAQVLGESSLRAPAPLTALRAALFVRAQRLIGMRFGDPDLTADAIASELGISTRLLQRIFAEHDETVMNRVWEERARRAAQLLAQPQAMGRTITDIAFSCGFNDSSHFGRAFAARMGVTPSQWRKQARDDLI